MKKKNIRIIFVRHNNVLNVHVVTCVKIICMQMADEDIELFKKSTSSGLNRTSINLLFCSSTKLCDIYFYTVFCLKPCLPANLGIIYTKSDALVNESFAFYDRYSSIRMGERDKGITSVF